jgi:WD40 repeat protein
VSRYAFISYSRVDRAYADNLALNLHKSGIVVWYDYELANGDRWEQVIKDRIDGCAALIVVMSPSAEQSNWVKREINRAEMRGKPILPLLLEGEPFFRLSDLQFDDVIGGGLPSDRFTDRLRSLLTPDTGLVTTGVPVRARVAGATLRDAFAGHLNRVWDAAFSPDGSWLATASDDHTIRIWDMRTGATELVLNGHTAPVVGVAISPDGSWLASASEDTTVRTWNAQTGGSGLVINGHTAPVVGVAISPDSRWLASVGQDNTVRIWNARTGASRMILTGHSRPVLSVAISPDGSWLASASHDCTVMRWDARTGAVLATLTGHTEGLLGVGISPDGSWLASAGIGGTVRIWDTNTAAQRLLLNGSIRMSIFGRHSPARAAPTPTNSHPSPRRSCSFGTA